MSTGTLDTGAVTIEVRIYRAGRLLVRELCESEVEATAVADHWSEVGNVYVLVDDLSAHHDATDILAPDELATAEDERGPIASAPIPGCGTE